MSPSTTLVLGNNTTSTSNVDLTGANQKIVGLTASSNNTTADIVTIGNGKTLTLTGAINVMGTDASITSTTKLVINGSGTLLVTPSAAQNITVGITQANQSYSSTTTLDLSSLSSVTLGTSAAPVGTLNIGFGQTVTGILILSNTANVITATTLQVGHSNVSNANGTNILTLGKGTNVIAADTINIGLSKSTSTLGFASQTAGSPGTVIIGGKSGPLANIVIGSNNGTGTASVATGTLELRGHLSTVTANSVFSGSGQQQQQLWRSD